MYEAIRVSLTLIKLQLEHASDHRYQPMVIFLTDGEPTIGVTDSKEIISQIKAINRHQVPIFCLSFGDGADRDLLKALSIENFGFSKHIYESSDAVVQLQDFYREISSPLLSNVTFRYADDIKNLSKNDFSIYFGGSEIIVTGFVGKNVNLLKKIINILFAAITEDIYEFSKNPKQVTGWALQGPMDFTPTAHEPSGDLERLWAYLTVKQLFEEMNNDTQQIYPQKIVELALKYSFVTPLTPFVVYKPNEGETFIKFLSTGLQYISKNDGNVFTL